MISRRQLIKGAAALGLTGFGLGSFAFAIEPRFLLKVRHYRVTPRGWPDDLRLQLAVVADVHAGDPYMPIARIEEIVATTNAMKPDAVLLLGDYIASHRMLTRRIPAREWAPVLARLRAPLGVHAVLGNHDWWDDAAAQARRKGPVVARVELERAGVPVYENDAIRLEKDGRPFWLLGLGDQIAFLRRDAGRRFRFAGVDDLDATLAKVTDRAPIVLMAHEPDIFPKVPARVSLTISGHTHGGQVRLLGYSPIVPSVFGNRYAYGHVVEQGRHLVVSGGLGVSNIPVRFGVPPEIVMIELGGAPAVSRSASGLSHA